MHSTRLERPAWILRTCDLGQRARLHGPRETIPRARADFEKFGASRRLRHAWPDLQARTLLLRRAITRAAVADCMSSSTPRGAKGNGNLEFVGAPSARPNLACSSNERPRRGCRPSPRPIWLPRPTLGRRTIARCRQPGVRVRRARHAASSCSSGCDSLSPARRPASCSRRATVPRRRCSRCMQRRWT